VRPYLAGRVGTLLPDQTGWFQKGEENLALIDLKGEPARWHVKRTVKLPARQIGAIRAIEPGRFVLLTGVADGVTTKVLQHTHMNDPDLRVLDVPNGGEKWSAAVKVDRKTRFLNVIGKYAYLPTVPADCGNECLVSPIDGHSFRIYDLSDPEKVRQVGEWAPAQPNRALLLYPNPERSGLIAVVEARMGFGIHFADFTDPVRPQTLAGIPTNGAGSGDRVMTSGDRAFFTACMTGIWYDISEPRSPKRLGEWFNHRWFRAMHVYGDTAIVQGYRPPAEVIDFRDPKGPKVVGTLPVFHAAWGPRVYSFEEGRLVTTDITDGAHPKVVGRSSVKAPANISGAWADGSLLYAVQGNERGGTLIVWDVSDPARAQELGRLTHPEIRISRTEASHWTAHGRVICASRGIVVITSLNNGARPQVIDARTPSAPRFLTHLATQSEEGTDCFPDGPYFHIKYWTGPGELWDLTDPESPRRIWTEVARSGLPTKSWVAGVPSGEVLLAPRAPYLKVVTVPRPSQVPTGTVSWAAVKVRERR
jgi:hypothetical protein